MAECKELLILSGKGGSGKTSITASIAAMFGSDRTIVAADCDVDAADLSLVMPGELVKTEDFYSGFEAVYTAPDRCNACGRCIRLCRFGAIKFAGNKIAINKVSCEGCGVCVDNCPSGCISLETAHCGHLYTSISKYGMLSHARLGVGGENSGKLVSAVRQQAQALATEQGAELIISDGPPGIGCPVIASLSGVSMALIVTEPTLSGLHDLKRVLQLTSHFKVPAAVCINKYDINKEISEQISDFCMKNSAPVLELIAYDKVFSAAQTEALPVIEMPELSAQIRDSIASLYNQLQERLFSSVSV